jgi:predicted nucleotidyltransferase
MDPPEISLILNELKLNDDCVANIYFHGSWPQGTCTSKSDRDLIIVTHSNQMPLCFRPDFDYFHQFELHKLFDKYDVCVYSLENFEELLKKNYLLCVQCLFLPNEFKIKEEIDFRITYLEKYYDPIRIKKVAFYEMFSSFDMMNSNINYPKRSSIRNQIDQSRKDYLFKNLFHGLRFLDIAQQLIQTRTIFNFTSVADLLTTMKEIRDDPDNQSNMKW